MRYSMDQIHNTWYGIREYNFRVKYTPIDRSTVQAPGGVVARPRHVWLRSRLCRWGGTILDWFAVGFTTLNERAALIAVCALAGRMSVPTALARHTGQHFALIMWAFGLMPLVCMDMREEAA